MVNYSGGVDRMPSDFQVRPFIIGACVILIVFGSLAYGIGLWVDYNVRECESIPKDKCEYEKCRFELWYSDIHRDNLINCLIKENLLTLKEVRRG